MSNMSGQPQPSSYKDVLTLTNNYQGLGAGLTAVQDAAGNSSPMEIALEAVNFSRTGDNTFQLDGVALTASATNINNVCGASVSTFPGGVIFKRTAVTVTPYNVLSTDYIVAVTVNAAGVTINLPAPAVGNIGQTFIIKDEVGNAGDQDITVQVTGGGMIDGEVSVAIEVDYGGFILYSNGTEYFSVS